MALDQMQSHQHPTWLTVAQGLTLACVSSVFLLTCGAILQHSDL